MNVRVQKLLVTVVTTDTNPASVNASVDAALTSLNRPRNGIYLASAELLGNVPTEHEIPDEPFNGEPDNDVEMRAHDDWFNNNLYPLLGVK